MRQINIICMMSLISMSLMLVTVLKMAKQLFIMVYGARGHLLVGATAHLWGHPAS